MSIRPSGLAAACALVFLAGCDQSSTPLVADDGARLAAAPLAIDATPIPDQYIVVFRDDVLDAPGLTRQLARTHGASVKHAYGKALKGFAGRLTAKEADALRRNPNVAYVEQDQIMTATATQSGATWGLDRSDQSALPLSTTYSYTNTGTGVDAYIIDTGILLGHAEFGGRAVTGFDAITAGGTANDCNGHGTHVAGTVGGSAYGIAKNVALVAVRVLDCSGSGSNSGVIAGVDWVATNRTGASVANMSLGGGASVALDQAVQRAITAGVTFVVAAGTGNTAGRAQDACNYSPARAPEAITIGATGRTDAKASFSNYGACVDFFAPGVGITSSWYTSNTATNTISGTSMAAPHVAGVAALYLQGNAAATPAAVRTALFNNTTKGIVTSANKERTANNHLLFSNY